MWKTYINRFETMPRLNTWLKEHPLHEPMNIQFEFLYHRHGDTHGTYVLFTRRSKNDSEK